MNIRLPFVIVLSAALLSSAVVFAKEKKRIPPAVREAFQKTFPEARDADYSVETTDGITHEVEFKQHGAEIEAVFEADGTLFQTEREIALRELPAQVVKGIKREHPEAHLIEAEQINDPAGNIQGYEVEISVGKEWYELDVDAEGRILKMETD